MSHVYPQPMPPPQPTAPIMIPNDDRQDKYYNQHDSTGSGIATSSAVPIVDESTYCNELLRQGYTNGLVHAIAMNRLAFAHCYWIVDNSGSMQTQDGQRIITLSSSNNKGSHHRNNHNNHDGNKLKFVQSSRWIEMVDTVEYHANLAALTHTPTTFRLLNNPGQHIGPQIFSIATTTSTTNQSSLTIDQQLAVAINTIQNTQPSGVTPLTDHLLAIRHSIESILPELRTTGQRVCIVLATDGLPTDTHGNSNHSINQQFTNTLRSLEGLPIWIVVRLCTDEEQIVEFWNELDSQLEISLEVLDDYVSEGKEIYQKNPWLTYGLPLHRIREMGFYNKILDVLDEQALCKSEIKDFIQLLFGNFDTPDPDIHWDQFCTVVEQLQQNYQSSSMIMKQWNPVHEKLMPWIDIKKLRHVDKRTGSWFGIF
jgi:hypothetical protein